MKEIIVMHEIFQDCRLKSLQQRRAETTEKKNSIATKPWIYCFPPQKKRCMYTGFILPFTRYF